jgi:hypothetical protein
MIRTGLLSLGAGALLALATDPEALQKEPSRTAEIRTTSIGRPTDIPSVKRNIALTARNYFLEHTHPASGLVRVVAKNFGPTTDYQDKERASIAATGFGLAVIANASKQGLVSRACAFNYCQRTLEFIDANYHDLTRNGWLFHYLHWQPDSASGKAKRWDRSEYSTIDTALFLAGALYCGQVFPNSRISELAEKFYARVDFKDMMTNGNAAPAKRTLSLSYHLEKGPRERPSGYSPWEWDHYAEHMLLLILALGSPNPDHRLPPEVWTAWERQSKTIAFKNLPPSVPDFKRAEDLIGYDRALFTHQYTHLFIDFRTFRDILGVNYFRNSVLATLYNREVCLNDPSSKTFRNGFWGLSAGDSPPKGSPNGDRSDRVRYHVSTPQRYDGTACIGCVPASAMFAPDVVLGDVLTWCQGRYGNRIWGRYGLADSMTLDEGGAEGWISPKVHGITVGPAFLALANLDEATSIWKDFMANPNIQRGLKAAGSAPRFKAQSRVRGGKAP